MYTDVSLYQQISTHVDVLFGSQLISYAYSLSYLDVCGFEKQMFAMKFHKTFDTILNMTDYCSYFVIDVLST